MRCADLYKEVAKYLPIDPHEYRQLFGVMERRKLYRERNVYRSIKVIPVGINGYMRYIVDVDEYIPEKGIRRDLMEHYVCT